MAEPIFDKEGNLSNLDELTAQEVATAYSEKNKSLFGRLTEEEAKRKQAEIDKQKLADDLEAEKKKSVKSPVEEPKTSAGPDSEELRLIARGLSDEEIDEAKVVAKGKGISLTEALKTPIFLLFQNNLKEEQKKEAAKLGASHGSGQESLDNPVKPGMTREEHKKAFDENRGKLT